jgi:hypothetical protein
MGILATFVLIFFFAFLQYRKQQKAKAKSDWDNIDKMFQQWGGRDNSKS